MNQQIHAQNGSFSLLSGLMEFKLQMCLSEPVKIGLCGEMTSWRKKCGDPLKSSIRESESRRIPANSRWNHRNNPSKCTYHPIEIATCCPKSCYSLRSQQKTQLPKQSLSGSSTCWGSEQQWVEVFWSCFGCYGVQKNSQFPTGCFWFTLWWTNS